MFMNLHGGFQRGIPTPFLVWVWCLGEKKMSEDLRSLDESRKEEQLAAGILAILSPAVEQVDGKIGEVRKSQAELRDKIDILAEELRVLSEKQKVPVDLDMYIKKLANSRRRIILVNDILQNIQDRLEKLHRNVTRESSRQKASIEACQSV